MASTHESAATDQETRRLIGQTFERVGSGLARPEPEVIRAGRAGGLAFDSLTTDVCVGCLPASQVCYGSCFAVTVPMADPSTPSLNP